MQISKATVAPVLPNVVITLTHDEAMKLRRVCYYNKTVAGKFSGNQNGGRRKADEINTFMGSLGNKLKASGVERY